MYIEIIKTIIRISIYHTADAVQTHSKAMEMFWQFSRLAIQIDAKRLHGH